MNHLLSEIPDACSIVKQPLHFCCTEKRASFPQEIAFTYLHKNQGRERSETAGFYVCFTKQGGRYFPKIKASISSFKAVWGQGGGQMTERYSLLNKMHGLPLLRDLHLTSRGQQIFVISRCEAIQSARMLDISKHFLSLWLCCFYLF